MPKRTKAAPPRTMAPITKRLATPMRCHRVSCRTLTTLSSGMRPLVRLEAQEPAAGLNDADTDIGEWAGDKHKQACCLLIGKRRHTCRGMVMMSGGSEVEEHIRRKNQQGAKQAEQLARYQQCKDAPPGGVTRHYHDRQPEPGRSGDQARMHGKHQRRACGGLRQDGGTMPAP